MSKVIALTGSPGVGKSTIAKILLKRGYKVKKVEELARKYNCIIDEKDNVKVIDTEKLKKRLKCRNLIIIEGHLSHLLNPDMVIVLRCNPLVLKRRLERRGWSVQKILENVEAELIDYILIEAINQVENVYEIDLTDLEPEKAADIIEEIIHGKTKNYRPGKIDWISIMGNQIDKIIRK